MKNLHTINSLSVIQSILFHFNNNNEIHRILNLSINDGLNVSELMEFKKQILGLYNYLMESLFEISRLQGIILTNKVNEDIEIYLLQAQIREEFMLHGGEFTGITDIITHINDLITRLIPKIEQINSRIKITIEDNKFILFKDGELNKVKINTESDLLIISCFANFNRIKDKKLIRINHILKKNAVKPYHITKNFYESGGEGNLVSEYLYEEDLKENNQYKNFLLNDKDLNIKFNYSSIVSSIFTNFKNFHLLFNYIFAYDKTNENELYLKLKNVDELSELNINQIFLIHNGNDSDKSVLNGKDQMILSNNKIFTITTMTLTDFCFYLEYLLYVKKDQSPKTEKKYTDYLKNAIVFYTNVKWSTIVETFQEHRMDISGGSEVRRHMVNQMDYKLSLFIDKINKKSYHEIVISNNLVDKKLYQSLKGVNSKNKSGLDFYHKDADTSITKLNDFFKNKIKTYDLRLDYAEYLNSLECLAGNDQNKTLVKLTPEKVIDNNSIIAPKIGYFSKDDYTESFFSSKNERLLNLNWANNLNKGITLIRKNQKRMYSTTTKVEPNLTRSKSIFLQKLRDILNESQNNDKLAQLNIEKSWLDIIENEFKNEQQLIFKKGNYILIKAIETLELVQWKKKINKKFGDKGIFLLDKQHLYVTLSILLNNYKHSSHTYLAYQVGYNILILIYLKQIKWNDDSANDSKKDLFNQFILNYIIKYNHKIQVDIDFNSLDWLNIKNEYFINIGLMFIQIFIEEPVNLFNFNYSNINKKLYSDINEPVKLILNEDFKNDLVDHIIIQPKNIPMVCEPNEWSSSQFGGFLHNKYIREDVITGSIQFNKHKFEGKEKLYKTINYLNKIKFSINNSLLNYLKNEGRYLLDSVDIGNKDKHLITLELADIYKNIPFYLNVHADWRGRVYTHSFYISYQGSDLSLAILEFWKGEKLNYLGKRYFYVYGANLYGACSKESNDNKEKWIENNISNILKLDSNFILKAKSPFLFAAYCLEMKKFVNDPDVIIKMPLLLDATCSGIQHLSAMTADLDLGSHVNLIYNKYSDKVQDIYQDLMVPINKAINDFGEANEEYKALKNIYLRRSDLKQPIMTQNYNVSIFGMKEQLFNRFKSSNPDYFFNKDHINIKANKFKIIGYSITGEEIILNNKDLFMISIIIKKVIFQEFPVLELIYNYFISIANLMNKLKLTINWITPSGIIITQNYLKTNVQKIRWNYGNKSKTNIVRVVTDKTDSIKQRNSIIPNIIHSLDASHLINLIEEYSKIEDTPVITVHDCFGTLPNMVDVLLFRLKEEFVYLYTNSEFLTTFEKRLIQNIVDNNYSILKKGSNRYVILHNNEHILIPKAPISKTLDFNEVMKSKYMFV